MSEPMDFHKRWKELTERLPKGVMLEIVYQDGCFMGRLKWKNTTDRRMYGDQGMHATTPVRCKSLETLDAFFVLLQEQIDHAEESVKASNA